MYSQYRKYYCPTSTSGLRNIINGRLLNCYANPGTGTLYNINQFYVDVPSQHTAKHFVEDQMTLDTKETIDKKESDKIENAKGDGKTGIDDTGFLPVKISEVDLEKLLKKKGNGETSTGAKPTDTVIKDLKKKEVKLKSVKRKKGSGITDDFEQFGFLIKSKKI